MNSEDYLQVHMVQIDEQFIADLGEELDKHNWEDYPHLVMDVWEDPELGTLWDLRHYDTPPADYVPLEETTTFNEFWDCHNFYNARDEVLAYFVLSMYHYANSKDKKDKDKEDKEDKHERS